MVFRALHASRRSIVDGLSNHADHLASLRESLDNHAQHLEGHRAQLLAHDARLGTLDTGWATHEQRLTALESGLRGVAIDACIGRALNDLSFWGRLRWLFTGR